MISVFDPMTQFLKANDARKKADLSQIQKAIEEFYQDAGAYPTSTEEYQIIGLDGKEVPWGTTWTPYMTQLPKPPDDTTYVYYTENGQSYYLYANLKKDNDPDLCEDLDENLECPGIADLGILSESCGGPCNYGVTSPNVSP